MADIGDNGARAVADVVEGRVLAAVEVVATPEQVFHSLTSANSTQWWVRPGVFDTREWAADVRGGGRWRASGVTRGQPLRAGGRVSRIGASIQAGAHVGLSIC